MKQTADSLVPLTADMVDGIKAAVEAPAESEPVKDVIEEEAPVPMTELCPFLTLLRQQEPLKFTSVKERELT
mgnify:CR=1 FL=1